MLNSLVILLSLYVTSKSRRLYYSLVDKYYVWYHITNNVILSKVLLTKVDKVSQDIKLIAANKRASKSFEISDQDEFNIFLKNVELLRTGTEGSINEPLKNTPKNSQDMVQSKITTQLNLEQLIWNQVFTQTESPSTNS